jgi:hypothetical protein
VKKIFSISIFLFFYYDSVSQQLENNSFEAWRDTAGRLYPKSWSVDAYVALWHSPSKEAHKGKYALVLSTWYSYVEGHLFYGHHQRPYYRNWKDYTVPFEGRPLKLEGYYRYTDPVNYTDSAGGQVLIKDINNDTLAYGSVLLDTASKWKKFEIPLSYFSNFKASSIAIHFTSRESGGGMNDDNNPNRLYLDSFEFIYKKEN